MSIGHSVDGKGQQRWPSYIRRLNTKLEHHGLDPMTDLERDFSSGVKLIQVRFLPTLGNLRLTRDSCWHVALLKVESG